MAKQGISFHFLKIVWPILGTLFFHMSFRLSLPGCTENPMGFSFNFHMSEWRINLITILSHLISELTASWQFLRSFSWPSIMVAIFSIKVSSFASGYYCCYYCWLLLLLYFLIVFTIMFLISFHLCLGRYSFLHPTKFQSSLINKILFLNVFWFFSTFNYIAWTQKFCLFYSFYAFFFVLLQLPAV